jgi:hypothetical protein
LGNVGWAKARARSVCVVEIAYAIARRRRAKRPGGPRGNGIASDFIHPTILDPTERQTRSAPSPVGRGVRGQGRSTFATPSPQLSPQTGKGAHRDRCAFVDTHRESVRHASWPSASSIASSPMANGRVRACAIFASSAAIAASSTGSISASWTARSNFARAATTGPLRRQGGGSG